MNRIASLAILPMMTLAIVVFSRFAESDTSNADPPGSGILVVANLRTESLSFIDLETGAVRELLVPGPPHEMVLSGGRLYVTLGRGNRFVEIDPDSGAILRVLELEGEPHGLAAWGTNLVVTLDKGNAAVVIDRATLTELRRYPTGNTPHVVAVSDDAILVTDSREDAIRQLEPESRTARTGRQPEGIAVTGGYAVTADAASGTFTIARAADLSGATTMAIGAGPVRVAAFEAARVLVSLQGQAEVALVDLAAPRVERRMKTAARPDGLCVSPDRKYFSVVSNAGGVAEIFAAEDWKRSLRLNLKAGLGACLWLGER